MTPEAPVDDALVADVARTLVERTAPQELPLFRGVSAAYFATPDGVRLSKRKQDDVLGFGADAALMLVTPVALEVAKTVLSFLATQVMAAVEHQTSDEITHRVQALFHRQKVAAGGAEPLTSEQLVRVHDLALEKARQLALDEPHAKLLADALIGNLATA